MQIRVANRQDEPIIRTIISQAYAESGEQPELELTGRDSDLTNIEANYFWYDGICLVAEEDGVVVGFVAARRAEDTDEILEIRRLRIVPAARSTDAEKLLLDTVDFFAQGMEYYRVILADFEIAAPPPP